MPFQPHDAARDALRRADDLLTAADTPGLGPEVAADMRRSSVVLAVAAVDTYMHRLIVDRFSIWSSLPKRLADMPVRLDQLVDGAKASYAAARRDPFDSRPGVGVKSVLRQQLLFMTFQTGRQIENALTMAGAGPGTWAAIGQHLNMTRKQIDTRLAPIVQRRNQIVHEGDYKRLDRPQKARLNPLGKAQARADIQFLRDLVDAIHGVV